MFDTQRIVAAIDPEKDVDGFHPVNVGRLSLSLPGFVPSTPVGCMTLIQLVQADISGMSAVVIGRSNIVGKPMAQLLLAQNCTVTIAHSKTSDLPAVCRQADILVAAVGIPFLVKADWIKPGAHCHRRRHQSACSRG
jgi:methylenetetrahydrofolate dehydrogenase (NADP+)/methenyltetrahydrofolate cyclohydrolase